MLCLLSVSIVFAESKQKQADDQYSVIINQTKIFAKNLTIIDGTGQYEGYLKMNGYPGENKFQIYFQDNSHDNITSMHFTYEDLRGIDLDEYFYFTYEGTELKITRRKANIVFSSFAGTDFGLFLIKTFPGAYNDWFEAQAFSTDAERLVNCYIAYKHQISLKPHGYDTVQLDASSPMKDRDDTTLDGMTRH